jgi:hypothetical protein
MISRGLIYLTLLTAAGASPDQTIALKNLLFPNRTQDPKYSRRQLLPDPNNPPAGVDQALCVTCNGLDYCKVLNGLLIQEVYYPQSNSQFGTCFIIDDLGKRLYNEIFGVGTTFRDTPECRTIVMQYLCLFWGSQNDMYTNLCFWKEEFSSPDPTTHKLSARPPCRGFCVQVISCIY